jgi:PadR family transcriptional regulator, regulatory protein AphA
MNGCMSLRGAILGFLSLEPMSGYTLKQRFDGSVRSFWTATQSQIYRELHALGQEGLVEFATVRGDGKPDAKVYSLTRDGRSALERWLEEPLEPMVLRHPLLLKLVFAAEVAPQRLGALLDAYVAEMRATRAEYRSRLDEPRIFSLARTRREASLWRLAVEHGVAWCDGELRWAERARRELGPAVKRRKQSAPTADETTERKKKPWSRKGR